MQISVEEMLKSDDRSSNQAERKNMFFSLKNDGDSAIVRFLHSDINDFEVLDVHTISLGGYQRKINCLRSTDGSKEECAICVANKFDEEKGSYTYPLQRRFYIHLLKYNNPQEAEEQIWERSKDYIKKLNQLAEDYGPLYNRLYKVVRHGSNGSMDTTYDILPLDKDRFNPESFIFDTKQLNYKKALDTTVLNKTNEDIKEYLNTGNFPGFKGTDNISSRPEVKQENIQPQVSSTPTFNQTNTIDQGYFDQSRRRF